MGDGISAGPSLQEPAIMASARRPPVAPNGPVRASHLETRSSKCDDRLKCSFNVSLCYLRELNANEDYGS